MVFKRLRILLIFILVLSMSACIKKQANSNIEGRFVFNRDSHSAIRGKVCIAHDGKVIEIKGKGAYPRWSPNGEHFVCFSDGLYIYDKEGNLVKKIPSEYRLMDCVWSKDAKNILYVGVTKDGDKDLYDFHIIQVSIEEENETIIYSFLNRMINFVVFYLDISSDGRRIIFEAGEEGPDTYIYIMNKGGTGVRKLYRLGSYCSWFPDNKHILFTTNTDTQGNKINNAWGRLYKMNVDTGEMEVIEETVKYWYKGTRVSSDGKYLVYSKPTKEGGAQIMICPIGPRDEDKEIPVTYSCFEAGQYTQDTDPDWYR